MTSLSAIGSDSRIRRLAVGRWLNHDPARCFMSFFMGYHDTSGKKIDPAIVTAGLIAPERAWLQFEGDWNEMLARFHIPYVHMSELAHCTNDPYKHLKGNESEKKKLFQRIHTLVSGESFLNVAAVMDVEDYKRINLEYPLEEISGGPTATCSAFTIGYGALTQQDRFPKSELALYHEDGDDERGWLDKLLKVDKLTVERLPKLNALGGWFVPFQACDYIAWEVRRSYLDRSKNKDWRKSFGNYIQNLNFGQFKFVVLDEPKLRHVLQTWGVVPRSASDPSASSAEWPPPSEQR